MLVFGARSPAGKYQLQLDISDPAGRGCMDASLQEFVSRSGRFAEHISNSAKYSPMLMDAKC
jgi:hypothetical protein